MPARRRAATSSVAKPPAKVRRTQKVPKIPEKSASYAKDEIVWCDLGHSYGWWPGMITNTEEAKAEVLKRRKQSPAAPSGGEDIENCAANNMPTSERSSLTAYGETQEEAYCLEGERSQGYRLVSKPANKQPEPTSERLTPGPVLYEVKFFDDDDFDVFRVRDLKSLKKYSGDKSKLKMIKTGIQKFSGEKTAARRSNGAAAAPSAMGIDNLGRQSQFIKDVEMAEVMTDNDPRVADLLSSVVYLDEEPNPAGELPNPAPQSSKSSAQSSKSSTGKKGKTTRKK